jgi:hypothetical protein
MDTIVLKVKRVDMMFSSTLLPINTYAYHCAKAGKKKSANHSVVERSQTLDISFATGNEKISDAVMFCPEFQTNKTHR